MPKQPTNRARLIRGGLYAYAVVVLAVQALLALGPDGWLAKYGLIDAAPTFFRLASADPLTAGGAVDFISFMLVVLAALILQLPAESRWGPRTWVFLPIYLFAPSVGILVYLAYTNPKSALFDTPPDGHNASKELDPDARV